MSSVQPGAAQSVVTIPIGQTGLEGHLHVPDGAGAIVLFAHGSGSSRNSPRNRAVAYQLRQAGLATLLLDLLTPEEEEEDRASPRLRFDIHLLASRLVVATDWLSGEPSARTLPLGYFGASTGAAAALVAGAKRPQRVGAVVSRGGRPELAQEALSDVRAPTLLIVGALDADVIELNRTAMAKMRHTTRLELIAGASHLFEEDGTLDEVAKLAAVWFKRYLLTPTLQRQRTFHGGAR